VTLTKKDALKLYRWLARSGALGLAIAKNRREVFGACLLHIRQEAVSVVPMFALYKAGILMESLVSGDHRTQWSLATAKGELITDNEGHNHIKEIFRNHFGRATGGNLGRDGNIHWGCLACRILPFMYSDMAGMVGTAVGYGQEIFRNEWADLSPEKRPISIAFYGEGSEQQGCIHEARNYIATSNYKWSIDEFVKRYGENFVTPLLRELKVVRGAPMIFVIVKNQYSLFADAIDEYGAANLVKRVSENAYGDMVGVEVNSDDIATYYHECEEAIKRAQECRSTLMVVDTYRGTGHNQDQVKYRGPIDTRQDLANVESVFGVDDMEEFHAAWSADPILYPHFLFDTEAADEETAGKIRKEEEQSLLSLAQEVLLERAITVEEDKKDRSIFPPIDWRTLPKEPESSAVNAGNSVKMDYKTAYNWIITELMRGDDGVIYLGEDSGSKEGGVLGLTRGARVEEGKVNLLDGLIGEFGPARIWNAPLSESAIIETAGGRALYGSKPFAEFQFGWFGAEAQKFIKVAGIQWYQRKMKFRFVSVFPCGVVRSGGSGEYHERYVEAELLPTRGLVILFPSNAYDLVGLVRACYYYDGPVALILEISAASLPEFSRDVPVEPYVIPFGKANIVRPGKDFTVVAYGAAAVSAAKNEADFLAKDEKIDAEVIDLRTVYPTDFETIKKSVKKTGRLVIMQAADEFTGAGHYIRSKLVGKNGVLGDILTYDAIEIVCAGMEGDLVTPSVEELVWARLPYYVTKTGRVMHRSGKLANAIREGMEYR